MKRLAFLVVLVVILLVGGGLTAQLVAMNNASPLPILQQTADPDASVSQVLPWKADQFFLLVGFILFNLIGMAATIAIVMWFLDRGLRKSRAEAVSSSSPSSSAAEQS